MILEARIDPKNVLLIDCEVSDAIGKHDGGSSDPNEVVDNIRSLIQVLASEMAAGLELTPAQGVQVNFAVRVNHDGSVVLARRPDDGQIHVSLKLA